MFFVDGFGFTTFAEAREFAIERAKEQKKKMQIVMWDGTILSHIVPTMKGVLIYHTQAGTEHWEGDTE